MKIKYWDSVELVKHPGEKGKVVAIVKQRRRTEYIVQQRNPSLWNYYSREDIKLIK